MARTLVTLGTAGRLDRDESNVARWGWRQLLEQEVERSSGPPYGVGAVGARPAPMYAPGRLNLPGKPMSPHPPAYAISARSPRRRSKPTLSRGGRGRAAADLARAWAVGRPDSVPSRPGSLLGLALL